MFKFLKKLFGLETIKETVKSVKSIVPSKKMELDLVNDFRRNYVMDVTKFEKDWVAGTGLDSFDTNINHEWFGAESIELKDGKMLLHTKYSPKSFNGITYEYCSGIVTSKRLLLHGYYEFHVTLPKGILLDPFIKLSAGDNSVTVLKGFSDDGGEYQRFETMIQVNGTYTEKNIKSSLINDGENKIGCLFTNDKVEVYVNDVLVKEYVNKDGEKWFDEKVTITMSNSHRSDIEYQRNVESTTMEISNIIFFRKP